MSARDLDWQDHGLCQYTDPEVFFPEKGGSVRDAYRICRDCPVRQQCLDYAIGNNIIEGIWGGMSYKRRRALSDTAREAAGQHKNHAGAQPCGTPAAYRRHYRLGEKPCDACRQAEARSKADSRRDSERRRERYARARAQGVSPREALAWRDRSAAA